MSEKKFIKLLFCLCCLSATAFAQKQKKVSVEQINIYAEDSFTRKALPAFVTLMKSDSTVIDTVTCTIIRNYYSYGKLYVPKISGEYILRAEYQGYKPCVKKETFDFSKKSRYTNSVTFQMKRAPKEQADSLWTLGMDEVVVKGTRLQVAYRGDTLVYDAMAFNIPEGEMLDALVRRLPGAELKSDGSVFINGKKVDYITLNGNEFFKGSNKVILENLPYFTVKELQVYEKEKPHEPKYKDGKKNTDYVMDIVMKREYAVGNIANAEAGLGTDERWKGKIFGMRYDDFSRISLFGNINNVNENRTPGNDGDWSPQKQQRGLLTTKQAGMNMNLNNRKKTFTLDHSALLEWKDENNTQNTRSENFASEGTILGISSAASRSKDFKFNDKLNIRYNTKKNYFYFDNEIGYNNINNLNSSTDSTFDKKLINRNLTQNKKENRNIELNGNLNWVKSFDSPYSLNVIGTYYYSKALRDKDQSLQDILYKNSNTSDTQNNYGDAKSKNFYYGLFLDNSYNLEAFNLSHTLSYTQSESEQNSKFYQLYGYGDRYKNEFVLPSTADSLQAALDTHNSFEFITRSHNILNSFNISYKLKDTYINLSVPISYTHDQIRYKKDGLDTLARRNYVSFSPFFNIRYKWNRNTLESNFYTYKNQPDMVSLMPSADTRNPLYTTLSNPNLKDSRHTRFNIRLDMNGKAMKPSLWLQFTHNIQNQSIGNRRNYDTETGRSTSMPDNVNGNWNSSLAFGIKGPLDKQQHWRYNIDANTDFIHSVDFAIAYNGAENQLSRVNTFLPSTKCKLTYSKSDFTVDATAKFSGNFSHEQIYGERDMSVYEYQFGLATQYTFPILKTTIASSINLYSQNGYKSNEMNSNDWVWNATLSRPFLKGMFVAKAEMYDILHQLSARSYYVNAQSRVETRFNSIPHYFMFSLSYRLAKKPKK